MQLIHASDEMKRGKIPSLLNLDYDAIMVEYKILHYFLPIKPGLTNLKNKRVNTSCHQTETEKWLQKENSLPLSTKVEQTRNFNSSIKYFQSICHDLKFICPFVFLPIITSSDATVTQEECYLNKLVLSQ